ncbi:MAG: hypothetical protein C4532_07540 [Candidatus Abyssobacteria bacterium SURF_17]|uniref:VanZ-like domain-containing protein n=1 Tax=Candidatus Abyssobacteria bacterium SURF_17 TaxID=2093361 RepID=A0A419F0J4_9BACT|nr:MAG: hypothetical protein C4532_07540 [Candidatus Abyssubacteria bacterium SURF_17]
MGKLFRGEMAGFRSRELLAWLYVAAMMFCIVLSLPLTPILWGKASKAIGPIFNTLGYIVLAGIAVGIVLHMISHRQRYGILSFILLAGFGATYFFLLKYQCKFPAERLHLMEYGLLAYLTYRAFRLRFKKMAACLLSFAFASAFGFIDEAIQYILPNRVFEFRDAFTNTIASALGILVVITVLKVNGNADNRRANSV